MAIAAGLFVAFTAFALDHGVYVGSERYVMGADCCPNLDYVQKRCRYLFVTGVAELDAKDGQASAPGLRDAEDISGLQEALKKPDNGHCHLFGE